MEPMDLRLKTAQVKYDLVRQRNDELMQQIFQLESKIYYLRQELGIRTEELAETCK